MVNKSKTETIRLIQKKDFYKTVECEITGKTPLLMNNPASMSREKKISVGSKGYGTAEEEAEKTTYRMKDGTLFIPSRCIFAFLINSAKGAKIGKSPAGNVFAGAVRIEPFQVSLNTKDFEVDSQRVVIQRQGIIKSRACLPEWKARFTIIYDSRFIETPEYIKDCIELGGTKVGLLDFRPQRKGFYGTFELSDWKEIN